MALNEVRQVLLDVFCYCYGLLLEHLDFLDGAVSVHDGWSGYRLASACVDVAANCLGSSPSESTDRQTVCRDFLRRIRGAMEQNLAVGSPAFVVFSDYATVVETSSEIPCVNLAEWQCVGEEISRSCYCRLLSADAEPSCISVGGVELEPAAEFRMFSVPRKEHGQGRIQCGFASGCFSFADYVNLPFYFFHEYLSHLHSAPMFSEQYEHLGDSFTDGWLLYYARLAYQRALYHESYPVLCHPLHRDHYLAQYLQVTLDDVKKPLLNLGYEQARRLVELARIGEERFERITLIVATTTYDLFTPGIPDLHGEFVMRVRHWLRRTATVTPQERANLLTYLDAILDGPTPVRGLMEWLLQT